MRKTRDRHQFLIRGKAIKNWCLSLVFLAVVIWFYKGRAIFPSIKCPLLTHPQIATKQPNASTVAAKDYCESAVSYMEKGDFKTAIEELKKAIELNPEYPKSEYAIAVCYLRMEPPDLKLAKEHFEKSKKLGYHPPEWFERHLGRLEGERE